MNEEIKKSDYRNLKNQIQAIRYNFGLLNDEYVKMRNSLKNNVIIDRRTLCEDELDNLKNNTSSIINEINTELLPIINNNI